MRQLLAGACRKVNSEKPVLGSGGRWFRLHCRCRSSRRRRWSWFLLGRGFRKLGIDLSRFDRMNAVIVRV